MKKIFYFLLPACCLLASCTKQSPDDGLVDRTVSYSLDILIPKSASVDSAYSKSFVFEKSFFNKMVSYSVGIAGLVSDGHYDTNTVQDIKFYTAHVTSTHSDFRYFKSVDIYLSADGMPEINLVSNHQIPDTTYLEEIEFNRAPFDLKQYISNPHIIFRVEYILDKIPDDDEDYYAAVFVKCKARPLH